MRGCSEIPHWHDSCAVIVDLISDFVDTEGPFARHYGIEDTEPLRAIIPEVRAFARQRHGNLFIMNCRSKYEEGQFGIPDLCTSEPGRRSLLPRKHFEHPITKIDNSILTAGDDVLEILQNTKHLVLAGITVTSCIRKSVEDCREKLAHLHIIIPKNLAAARANAESQAQAQALFKAWERDDEDHVHIFDRWQEIEFSSKELTLPWEIL